MADPAVQFSNQFLEDFKALYELEPVLEVDLLEPDYGLLSGREALSGIIITPN